MLQPMLLHTHRSPQGAGRPLGPSPFASAAPSILVALAALVAAGAWVAAGPALPGGRVMAVHLLTLGAVTTLILTFSEHFARTLTRAPGDRHIAWPIVTTASIVLLLVGLATGRLPLLAVGATATLAVVAAAALRLRRLRQQAIGARFLWVVRCYEAAHGLFLVAGVLGTLLGLGLVTGGWFTGLRLAHLHANILGWCGLTLLATLVFFGPTMVRTRIEPGADADAARLQPATTIALTVAVGLLSAVGLDGAWSSLARVAAAGALSAGRRPRGPVRRSWRAVCGSWPCCGPTWWWSPRGRGGCWIRWVPPCCWASSRRRWRRP